jgi:hypothetical protein
LLIFLLLVSRDITVHGGTQEVISESTAMWWTELMSKCSYPWQSHSKSVTTWLLQTTTPCKSCSYFLVFQISISFILANSSMMECKLATKGMERQGKSAGEKWCWFSQCLISHFPGIISNHVRGWGGSVPDRALVNLDGVGGEAKLWGWG